MGFKSQYAISIIDLFFSLFSSQILRLFVRSSRDAATTRVVVASDIATETRIVGANSSRERAFTRRVFVEVVGSLDAPFFLSNGIFFILHGNNNTWS